MKFKKIMIVALFLFIILTLGAVNATDTDNNDTLTINEDITDNDNFEVIENENLIGNGENGTLSEIQSEINNADDGDTINLEKEHYTNSEKTTVDISKSITLNGNNAILDANENTVTIDVTADSVIIKGFRFINGKINNDYGIIHAQKTCTIEDCTFENYNIKKGCLIASETALINIKNCTFTNITTTVYDIIGGFNCDLMDSIFNNCKGSVNVMENGKIINTNFTNCNPLKINFYGEGLISECKFINCSDDETGIVKFNNVQNSTFINCHAQKGGAIYLSGEKNFTIKNCEFINSTGLNDEAVYCDNIVEHIIENCNFTNCSNRVFFIPNQIKSSNIKTIRNTVILTVEFNESISQEFTVLLNNETHNLNSINGKCTFTQENLESGNYNITAIFKGNEYYLPINQTYSFNIKLKPEITINVSDIQKGEKAIINITVSDGISKVNVKVGTQEFTRDIVNNTCQVICEKLDGGNYTVTVYIEETPTSEYYEYSESVNFTVKRSNPYMRISAEDIYEGENATIYISTNIVYSGILKINNQSIPIELNSNGGIKHIISDLPRGEYNITFIFLGDNNYLPGNVSNTFTVKAPKIKTSINISIPEAREGEDIIAYIWASEGVESAECYFDGIIRSTMHVSQGNHSINIYRFTKGNHTMRIVFKGNSQYLPCEQSINFTVKPIENRSIPKLEMNFKNTYEGEDAVINIISEKNITLVYIDFNNTRYNVTLKNGIGQLIIPKMDRNSYEISLIFEGNDDYRPWTNKSMLHVHVKIDTNTTSNNKTNNSTESDVNYVIPKIVALDETYKYCENGKYTVQVYGKEGKAANNVKVTFTSHNKKLATVTTDKNGYASFKVTQAPGTYIMKISALGVEIFKKMTVKSIISLKKVTVKKSSKKLVLTATLSKVNGKYIKNKKITFKFNGKKYNAYTNSKGVAKVTIGKSVLKKLKVGKKVTYQASYLKDSTVKTAKVKK